MRAKSEADGDSAAVDLPDIDHRQAERADITTASSDKPSREIGTSVVVTLDGQSATACGLDPEMGASPALMPSSLASVRRVYTVPDADRGFDPHRQGPQGSRFSRR